MFRLLTALLSWLLLIPVMLQAQQENVWIFGRNAGIDFNYPAPVPITSAITGFGEGAASVCDQSGQLLFYTDGDTLWTRSHLPMPNGSNVTGLGSASGYSATSSTSQGALIVPMPGNSDKYYVLSLTAWEQGVNQGRLYYSVVDMNLNGGFGDVEPNRRGILVDSNLTEHMTGVQGDHCNMWVVVAHRFNSGQGNQFKSFEINGAGINTIPVVSTVSGIFTNYMTFGRMKPSPDRKKIAIAKSNMTLGFGSTEVYDFDPATGVLSNTLALNNGSAASYGVCFSPDNSKLYINEAGNQIYQLDLSGNNIATIMASKTFICNSSFTDIKQGPDNKLYFIVNSALGQIGSINQPDAAPAACMPDINALQVLPGTVAYAGFPNVVPIYHQEVQGQISQLNAPCFAQQATINAAVTSGWDYIWEDGSTGADRAVSAPGSYRVNYYTAPCIQHTDTFIVHFPGGTIPVTQQEPACNGAASGKIWVIPPVWDTLQYTYAWYNAAGVLLSSSDSMDQVPAGTYHLHINTASGCDTTLTIVLSAIDPRVSFDTDTLLCLGEQLLFQNTSAPQYVSFGWYFGDGNNSNATSPQHQYNNPGIYEAMLTGAGGNCRDTARTTVYVDAPVTGISFSRSKDPVCMGTAVYFNPDTDSTALQLFWDFGDGTTIPGEHVPVQHAYDHAGKMYVRLRASFRACPDQTHDDSVVIHEYPQVYLGPDTVLCLHGRPVLLQNMAAPSAGATSLWNTGSSAGTLEVRHPGDYSLTVTSEYGCATTEKVRVLKDCYIDMPNAFTPNSDGVNDYFFPRSLLSAKVTLFDMQVFNRWGQVVFATQQIKGRGWDGAFNNKPQPEGVYIYKITVEIDGHINEQYTGNVTLIR